MKNDDAASPPNEADDILALTIASNSIAAATANTNPYELRNEVLNKKRVRQILYKNGRTLPATAEALQAEAQRKARHSRILGRHIVHANSGAVRPAMVDAHHIVAVNEAAAGLSRRLIFKAGIGINDAANGVFLPRFRCSVVDCLPNAHKHRAGLHTGMYHLSVYEALREDAEMTNSSVRTSLRLIAVRLVEGTFPY